MSSNQSLIKNAARVCWCSLFLLLSVCQHEKTAYRADMEPYARYLIGVRLLESSRDIKRFDQKAMRLEQLQTITGLPYDSVTAFLARLKNEPERGLQLYETMEQLLKSSNDTLLSKTK